MKYIKTLLFSLFIIVNLCAFQPNSKSTDNYSFKEKIENNPVLWAAGIGISAFILGASAVIFVVNNKLGFNKGQRADKIDNIPTDILESLNTIYTKTNSQSEEELYKMLSSAKREIIIFGLTRNYYAQNKLLDLIKQKAHEIPIHFYMMDPECESRKDRYRIEPIEASFEDKERYKREIEGPFLDLLKSLNDSPALSNVKGISFYYYNFPCSFAMELIDDHIRVMLYGHGKRGTESPIFIIKRDSELGEYFTSQLNWIESLANNTKRPWTEKGITIRKLKG